jgi:hypothetical protein
MGAVAVLVFRDVLLGFAGAVLVMALRRWRHGRVAVPQAVRRGTFAGAVLGILMMIAVLLGSIGPLLGLPGTFAEVAISTRFLTPLVAGLLAISIALLPRARRRGGSSVVLARRTLLTFAPRGWFVTFGAVVVLVLAVTLAAGMASRPDAEGRWRNYTVDVGVMSLGTEIYGWYYSVPALVPLAALLVLVIAAMAAITRPPLVMDAAADSVTRRWRARHMLVLATGAVLLHLSRVLASLSATASIEGGTSTTDGWMVAYGRFAGMKEPLYVVSELVGAAGWACWFAVLLSAALTTTSIPTLRREPTVEEQVR